MQQTAPIPRNGHGHAANGSAVDAAILDRLERIDRRLATLEGAVTRLDALTKELPATIATLGDTFDGIAARLSDAGIDLDERARVIARVTERLTAPEALATVEEVLAKVDTIRALLRSGVLDPAPVSVVAKAGEALAKAASESPPSISAWGALRAFGKPDVSRAAGFLLRVAELFGRALEDRAALPEKTR